MGSRAVAAIVADTMDNYLLAGHILRCKLLSADEVRPELWIGANRAWRKVPRDRVARVAHNKERTGEDRAKVEDRLLRRQNEKKRKLSVLGIDYDFGEAEYVRELFHAPNIGL
jgi:nucleolar protein 15